jgi:PAS domain S-box-containing protein
MERYKGIFIKPFTLLVAIAASIFVASTIVNLILSVYSPLSLDLRQSLMDAGLMVVILFPVMYFLVYERLVAVIKDLHKSEKAFQASDTKYRGIFDQSPFGILIIDTDGNIIEFNETARRELGYSREEFSRLRIFDINPESAEKVQNMIKEVLSKGSYAFDVKHKTKQGEIRDVHVIVRVLDLDGTKVFQAIWQDITERKCREEELHKYREQSEEMVMKQTDATKANEKTKPT